MPRPTVDVVVPFAGSGADRADLERRLEGLQIGPGDTVTVVDNTAPGRAGGTHAQTTNQPGGAVVILTAPELPTPAYARNRGAEGGDGEWIVFLDADVDAPADLLERYFEPAPAAAAGLLAGGVHDAPPHDRGRASAAARYATIRRVRSQDNTFLPGRWGFAQTASCAVRRTAFEQVGGFREEIRAGEDADLCYRLRDHGWELERRERAAVAHRNRDTIRALLSQSMCHGAGAGWLNVQYPGSFPPYRWLGLVRWALRDARNVAGNAVRGRNEDTLVTVLDTTTRWAFQLGRHRSNIRRRR